GAEGLDLLAGGRAGARVAAEGVERMLVVRDLEAPVRAPRRPEQGGLHSRAGVRLAARQQRGPVRGALPGASALAVLVLHEQVERPALRVYDDRAEAGVAS